MELWIRSQDKKSLVKVDNLYADVGRIVFVAKTGGRATIGIYSSQERALEVLDEIQKKIKTLLYLKPQSLLGINEIKAGKKYFEKFNSVDFITCDNNFEIEPITTNAIVYEMPEE